MKRITFILAFLALFASVQALSFSQYDINSNQPDANVVAADGNTVVVAYYGSEGATKAAFWDPTASSFSNQVTLVGAPANPTEIRVVHIYNSSDVWIVMLASNTIYSTTCNTSGSCNPVSQLYPWGGFTNDDVVYDIEVTTVEWDPDGLGGSPPSMYGSFFMYLNSGADQGNQTWLDQCDMDASYGLDNQLMWTTGCGGLPCGSRDNVYSDPTGTAVIYDIATDKIYDSSGVGNGGARVAVAWRIGTTCYYDRYDFVNGWPASPNDSWTCSAGRNLIIIHSYYTAPLTSTKTNVDVVIYWNGTLWKARLYRDGVYVPNSEVSLGITGYMSGQACRIENPDDDTVYRKQAACVWANADNTVHEGGFSFTPYGINVYNIDNPIGVSVSDETIEAILPETVWDSEENKFGFVIEKNSAGNLEYALLTPGANVTLPTYSADCTVTVSGSVSDDGTWNCINQSSFPNLQASSIEALLTFYNASVGSDVFARYKIPTSLAAVDFSSTTFTSSKSVNNSKIEVANSPSNIPRKDLGFPHFSGNTAWATTAAPPTSLATAECTLNDPEDDGETTTCTDVGNTVSYGLTIDAAFSSEGIDVSGSGAGDDPPPLPEIPMDALLLVVGVVLIVTFFLSRLAQRKSLK